MPEYWRREAQKKIGYILEKIRLDDYLGRATSTFKSLYNFLDEDMSHLIIPSMKEAKELDRFRSETLFEAIPELGEIDELRYAYEHAETLDDPEPGSVMNFAQGEGTVD